MSEKVVGVIGQKYEDRKTGKCGVLESRDDKYKTLLLKADDGSTFNISNSSFRSNWRKVKEDEEVIAEENVESVSETVEDAPEKKQNVTGLSEADAIEKFISDIKGTRKIDIMQDDDITEIFVDDMVVTRMQLRKPGVYALAVMPDVFSLSNWGSIVDIKTIHYQLGAESYLGVTFVTHQTSIPEILNVIEDAVRDINLYGYNMEE